jgi:hypothetical protein
MKDRWDGAREYPIKGKLDEELEGWARERYSIFI